MRLFRKVIFLLISLLFLCNTSLCAQDTPKAAAKLYSQEQIIKQNIVTVFRWVEAGALKKEELRNVISFIKRQLAVLKKECASGRGSCAAVYEHMDNSFFAALAKDYEFEGGNSPLLNRIYIEAAKETNTTLPRHPWLDIKNNLIDCLENEVVIACSGTVKSAKTDLTKPEIYVAADINSVVDLVNKSVPPVLNSRVNLSGAYKFIHSGSTSRGTSLDNADFDFEISFENQRDFDNFLKKIKPIVNLVSREWKAKGYKIISADFKRQAKLIRLITFLLQNNDGIAFKIHISVGKNLFIYPDNLNSQIEQIKALGGNWEYVRGQIILFKRLIRDVLHSYGRPYVGLDGTICEQFIIQADSSTDYGKKITSIGSFDNTMHWIYDVGFNQALSVIIPFDIATKPRSIYRYSNKYSKIECSAAFWDKLVRVARKYVILDKSEMSEDEFAGLGRTY